MIVQQYIRYTRTASPTITTLQKQRTPEVRRKKIQNIFCVKTDSPITFTQLTSHLQSESSTDLHKRIYTHSQSNYNHVTKQRTSEVRKKNPKHILC